MNRSLLAAAGALALAACSTADTSSVTATEPLRLPSALQAETSGIDPMQSVARSVALALEDPAVRAQLRNAWRDSRISADQKLVLGDFVTSPNGTAVLTAMARRAGRTPNQLLEQIAALPALDFYVPVRKHRQTWKGTEQVLVAATSSLNPDSVVAFAPDGSTRTVTKATVADGPALIVLHRAEPKPTVRRTRAGGTGDVIDPTGLPKTTGTGFAISAIEEEPCEPYCAGGGDGGTPPATGVYLTYFDTFRDDGWLGGDLEMEFRSIGWEGVPNQSGTYWFFTSTTCAKGTGTANFHANPPYTNMLLLISPGVTSSNFAGCGGANSSKGYGLYAVEMDFDSSAEDDFGKRFSRQGASPGQDLMPFNMYIGTAGGYDYWSDGGTPYAPYNTGNPERSVHLKLAYR